MIEGGPALARRNVDRPFWQMPGITDYQSEPASALRSVSLIFCRPHVLSAQCSLSLILPIISPQHAFTKILELSITTTSTPNEQATQIIMKLK